MKNRLDCRHTMLTRTTILRFIKIGGGILVTTIVVAYAISRSTSYVRGPQITITNPANWASIAASTTIIQGRIDRANNLTLNGRDISIDEYGNFNEHIIVFPGTNIITLEAHDQFERKVKTELRLQGL